MMKLCCSLRFSDGLKGFTTTTSTTFLFFRHRRWDSTHVSPPAEETADPFKSTDCWMGRRGASVMNVIWTTITHNSIKLHLMILQPRSNQSVFHKRIMLQQALKILQITPLSSEDTWVEVHTCLDIQTCVCTYWKSVAGTVWPLSLNIQHNYFPIKT